MEDLFYSYPWISLATSTKANITLYMCNWQKFSAMAAKVWKEGKLQVTVWEQEPGMFSLGVTGKQSLHKRRGNMERKTASKLSLECIFLCFLCSFPFSHSPLSAFQGSHPTLRLHPELTVQWAFPALSIPLFLPQFILKELCASHKKTEKLSWKPFLPPNSVLPDCCFFLPCTTTFVWISAYTGGGLQGVAVFPLISSTSKRSQHYFCCQLCLCDRLWTIWMSLHLAAIKAPQFRTPHLGLPAPHRAELASPQRPELAHKHQTTSQNPISTSPEQQAAEEMLLSNLRVGCAQWLSPYLTNYSNLHR